jgi:hypothetical protein
MVVFPFVGDTVDTVFSSLHLVPSGSHAQKNGKARMISALFLQNETKEAAHNRDFLLYLAAEQIKADYRRKDSFVTRQ